MIQGPWRGPPATIRVWRVTSSLGPGVWHGRVDEIDLVALNDKLNYEIEAAGGFGDQPGYATAGDFEATFTFALVVMGRDEFIKLPAFNGFDHDNTASEGAS